MDKRIASLHAWSNLESLRLLCLCTSVAASNVAHHFLYSLRLYCFSLLHRFKIVYCRRMWSGCYIWVVVKQLNCSYHHKTYGHNIWKEKEKIAAGTQSQLLTERFNVQRFMFLDLCSKIKAITRWSQLMIADVTSDVLPARGDVPNLWHARNYEHYRAMRTSGHQSKMILQDRHFRSSRKECYRHLIVLELH